MAMTLTYKIMVRETNIYDAADGFQVLLHLNEPNTSMYLGSGATVAACKTLAASIFADPNLVTGNDSTGIWSGDVSNGLDNGQGDDLLWADCPLSIIGAGLEDGGDGVETLKRHNERQVDVQKNNLARNPENHPGAGLPIVRNTERNANLNDTSKTSVPVVAKPLTDEEIKERKLNPSFEKNRPVVNPSPTFEKNRPVVNPNIVRNPDIVREPVTPVVTVPPVTPVVPVVKPA